MEKKKQQSVLAKVIVLLAITMVASNSVVQFIENLTKNYAIAVIAFIFILALLNTKLLEVFK